MHLIPFPSIALVLALWLSTGSFIRVAHHIKSGKPTDSGWWVIQACLAWGWFYWLTH